MIEENELQEPVDLFKKIKIIPKIWLPGHFNIDALDSFKDVKDVFKDFDGTKIMELGDKHHVVRSGLYVSISKCIARMFIYVCGRIDHRPRTDQLNCGRIWLKIG